MLQVRGQAALQSMRTLTPSFDRAARQSTTNDVY